MPKLVVADLTKVLSGLLKKIDALDVRLDKLNDLILKLLNKDK
jgi:hypothetical protein